MSGVVELARVTRGPAVESRHLGAVVVADAEGGLVRAWGDPGLVTFPRSSLKPFAAIGLIESGAADAFGLTDAHLAFACASHWGEPFQAALAEEWLARLGLEEGALVCGAELPRGEADMARALAAGGRRRLFHNCSGKHCGFLSVARRLGGGLGYADPAHPAQRLYAEVLGEAIGGDAAALPWGVDGCSLPAPALSLHAMAAAAARFAAARLGGPARQAAVRRLQHAIAAHPDHLSGRDGPEPRLMRATGGRVLVKGGAEGFVLALVPDRGLGIAVKLLDGADRAKRGALAAVLQRLGLVEDAAALIAAVEPPVTDANGAAVGRVEITLP